MYSPKNKGNGFKMHYVNSISRAHSEGNPIHSASPTGRKAVKLDLVSAASLVCTPVCARMCAPVHAPLLPPYEGREAWHSDS